jgi:acetyl esterase/lipase
MKKFIFLIGALTIFLSAIAAANVLAQSETTPSLPIEDRIDPEFLDAYSEMSPLDLEKNGLDGYRGYFTSLVGSPDLPSDPAVEVYDTGFPVSDSEEQIRIRIYKPIKLDENAPGIYWIHGGGFLFGVPEQDEAQSIRWAKEVGAVVAAVEYRKAPEHPYPVPLEDAYAGLVWFSEQAESLGVDKNRIAVAGASAGGNLAAAVALLARDRGGPTLAFQMPLYPMIDDRFMTPASHEDFGNKVWNNTDNAFAWKLYLGDISGTDQVTQYMAPARAENLSGLPPAYSCVGTVDPFRDDAINYMARLSQSGAAVEFHLYPRAFHAFEALVPDANYSKAAKDEYVSVLKKALTK